MSNTQATAPAREPEAQSDTRVPKEVIRRVAETVSNCEFSIDHAYVATAEYAMLMPAIRGQTKLPFGAATESVNRATEALQYLAQARQAIRESHEGLNVLAKKSGIDLRMDFPLPWK